MTTRKNKGCMLRPKKIGLGNSWFENPVLEHDNIQYIYRLIWLLIVYWYIDL